MSPLPPAFCIQPIPPQTAENIRPALYPSSMSSEFRLLSTSLGIERLCDRGPVWMFPLLAPVFRPHVNPLDTDERTSERTLFPISHDLFCALLWDCVSGESCFSSTEFRFCHDATHSFVNPCPPIIATLSLDRASAGSFST